MPEHRLHRRADKCLKILRCVEGGTIAYNILDNPASYNTVVGQNQECRSHSEYPRNPGIGVDIPVCLHGIVAGLSAQRHLQHHHRYTQNADKE